MYGTSCGEWTTRRRKRHDEESCSSHLRIRDERGPPKKSRPRKWLIERVERLPGGAIRSRVHHLLGICSLEWKQRVLNLLLHFVIKYNGISGETDGTRKVQNSCVLCIFSFSVMTRWGETRTCFLSRVSCASGYKKHESNIGWWDHLCVYACRYRVKLHTMYTEIIYRWWYHGKICARRTFVQGAKIKFLLVVNVKSQKVTTEVWEDEMNVFIVRKL